MKKALFCAALLVAGFSTRSSAQLVIRYGPEVGVNMSTFSGLEDLAPDAGSLIGFRVGGVVDLGLNDHLHIQPAVIFSSQGSKVDDEESWNFSYIQIPVNVFYHFNLASGSVFVGGGPYIAYAIGAKAHGEDESEDFELGTSDTDDFSPMDGGITLAGGFQTNMGIYVKAGYVLGLMNTVNDNNPNNGDFEFKNRTAFIAIGYLFGGGSK